MIQFLKPDISPSEIPHRTKVQEAVLNEFKTVMAGIKNELKVRMPYIQLQPWSKILRHVH